MMFEKDWKDKDVLKATGLGEIAKLLFLMINYGFCRLNYR